MTTAGVEPKHTGMSPAPAALKILRQTELNLNQMDVIELNEAFAAQGIAVLRELDIGVADERVNPNGSWASLGNEWCAADSDSDRGASQVTRGAFCTMYYDYYALCTMHYALCTMCIGMGQSIAMVIEKVWSFEARKTISSDSDRLICKRLRFFIFVLLTLSISHFTDWFLVASDI